MSKRCGLSAVFAILGLVVSPALVFPQTAAVQNNAGLDASGKLIVAVLPLAGDETEMIRRFRDGTMEAVAALGKYAPREVSAAAVSGIGMQIPTDMPPLRSLVNVARYALTGGVYPGERAGEYYLQLWLWDMAGSTMIYTDDLVYDDMDGAMQSLPGLVEWLFSHIHEVTIEEPQAAAWTDPLFMLGLRMGLSQRWYTEPGEVSSGASALNLEGGVSGAVRLGEYFSFQLEMLLTGDTLVYRGLDWDSSRNTYTMENRKYTNLSLIIPFLLKANFRTDPVRLSPLAGLYAMAPLGQTRYRYSAGEGASPSWYYSVPLGFTVGLEGAVRSGPGRVFGGLRYAADIGTAKINDGQEYRRTMFSLYLGYEFGFSDGKKLEDFLGEFL
jgi:hypothetical protein